MKILVITPPLVQLNSPYPSGAYLSSFFKENNQDAVWYDLNIKIFYSIFSSQGLTKIFELSETGALKKAEEFERNGEDFAAYNIRRYISSKKSWIQWIDFIVSILCDGNKGVSGREKEHQFLFSPFAPRGNRMDSFLSSLNREPGVDDVKFLCSYALADLADYITAVFDSGFSLVRYAESLTVDTSSFQEIEKNLDAPVLKYFYQPVLQDFLLKEIEKFTEGISADEKFLVCISVPFAGTFIPALYTADFLKKKFGEKAFICFGGGFINTELRTTQEKALGKYIDAISYDRGYGSYWRLLLEKNGFACNLDDENIKIYKLRRFLNSGKIVEPEWKDLEAQTFEENATVEIVPDYSSIDFSKYPRVCDDENPMHRMWSDGAWIKAYLAHGCYWHKCAFCDTQLDYVCGYKPVNTEKVYEGLKNTCDEKGVYGIHFVDEALPPAVLKKFAKMNIKDNVPIYYWGNIRFEKTFTKDLAAFLSYGGFAAVSAGLEVATGEGLKHINKGTDIESIVSACAAFKEAGILVHAYMIYGFWYDTPQTIIDSMETLRQFFAAGLLDSAFWHKFVLTRNSQVYTEWKQGLHPDLKPLEPKGDGTMFAQNNLNFKGEREYNKFGNGLDNALNAWMHGEHLNTKVQKWFDFSVPAPTIPKDFVEKCIVKYEKKNSRLFENGGNPTEKEIEGLYWIGSEPIVSGNKLYWMYLQEENQFSCQDKKQAMEIRNLLLDLSGETEDQIRSNVIDKLKKSKEHLKLLQNLHGMGLVRI